MGGKLAMAEARFVKLVMEGQDTVWAQMNCLLVKMFL